MADYQEYQPCAALRPFVACYWTWRSEVAEARKPEPARSHRVLPDGCMDILFHVDPSAGVIDSSVVGAMTVASTVPDAPGADRVAVRFLPGGAYPFLRVPARALTDQSVSLADLAGAASRDMEAHIFEAADRVAALETFLLGWLRRERPCEKRLLAAIRAVWQRPEAFTIDDLCVRAGLGGRQLGQVRLSPWGGELPPHNDGGELGP